MGDRQREINKKKKEQSAMWYLHKSRERISKRTPAHE